MLLSKIFIKNNSNLILSKNLFKDNQQLKYLNKVKNSNKKINKLTKKQIKTKILNLYCNSKFFNVYVFSKIPSIEFYKTIFNNVNNINNCLLFIKINIIISKKKYIKKNIFNKFNKKLKFIFSTSLVSKSFNFNKFYINSSFFNNYKHKYNFFYYYFTFNYFFLNIKINSYFIIYCKSLKFKKKKINIFFFLRYLISIYDYSSNINNIFFLKNNLSFFSNKYLINYLNIFDSQLKYVNLPKNNFNIFNNYYPLFAGKKKTYDSFYKIFKKNYNLNYIHLTNKLILTFLEKVFNKNIFLKINNNFFLKINNEYFENLLNEYKNFQPQYFKNYFMFDFLEIVWYSFLLKDLNMLSEWISKFMETLNFKNHKKFINFFQNFMFKHSSLFINNLKIKGFLFDIRGKVGVTGSSKKRHVCFKFGSLNRSSKNSRFNFNQSLVRTYSGVLGLTYIISY